MASTGAPFKLPRGVGDTPLIGAEVYADGQTGGCASTEWGGGDHHGGAGEDRD